MRDTDFFHTRIISNSPQDVGLIGSEKRCSLRHKKKILPGDKVSVQKNFPRFYEKCVNKRNAKKGENRDPIDNNLITVDAILDKIESVTLEENSLLSVRYRIKAADSCPKVIYAHKKSPDLSRRTRYQLAKELEQELRKKVLRPVVSSPPDNSVRHQALEEELLRKRLLRPLLSCPSWNNNSSPIVPIVDNKVESRPIRPSSRIQLLASLIMGSAQGGCKAAPQPSTRSTVKTRPVSANFYNRNAQTALNRNTVCVSSIKEAEIERTSRDEVIKHPDDSANKTSAITNASDDNCERGQINSSVISESPERAENTNVDSSAQNVEKVDRPSSLPDISSPTLKSPSLCRSVSDEPRPRFAGCKDLQDLKAMAERLHLNTQPADCQEWFSKVSNCDLTQPHPPTLVKVELIGEDEKPLSEEQKRQNAIAWLRKELADLTLTDQKLARQLMQLRIEIQKIRLNISCSEHQAMVDEVMSEMEELKDQNSELCDLPLDPVHAKSPLRDLGVTKMNITNRRFSLS